MSTDPSHGSARKPSRMPFRVGPDARVRTAPHRTAKAALEPSPPTCGGPVQRRRNQPAEALAVEALLLRSLFRRGFRRHPKSASAVAAAARLPAKGAQRSATPHPRDDKPKNVNMAAAMATNIRRMTTHSSFNYGVSLPVLTQRQSSVMSPSSRHILGGAALGRSAAPSAARSWASGGGPAVRRVASRIGANVTALGHRAERIRLSARCSQRREHRIDPRSESPVSGPRLETVFRSGWSGRPSEHAARQGKEPIPRKRERR